MLDMLLLILLFILITVIDLIINRTEQGIYFNLSKYIYSSSLETKYIHSIHKLYNMKFKKLM